MSILKCPFAIEERGAPASLSSLSSKATEGNHFLIHIRFWEEMEAIKQFVERSNDYIIAMSEGQEMRSQPAVALLSNGSYTVMITAACAGYSTWRDLDI